MSEDDLRIAGAREARAGQRADLAVTSDVQLFRLFNFGGWVRAAR